MVNVIILRGMEREFYSVDGIGALLRPHGLVLLGNTRIADEDSMAGMADGIPVRQLLLVGNGGSSMWPVFSRSPEFADGRPDALDRWSRRIGRQLATGLGGRAIFPFEGPPYPPFLAWAGRAGSAVSSRLALFIHERFGLWHAYRFALAVPGIDDHSPTINTFESPCLSCADKPCLGACPVDAFSGASYRADLCMDYLSADAKSTCRQLGCESRRACPVGKAFTYLPEQAKFHMNAFVRSRQG